MSKVQTLFSSRTWDVVIPLACFAFYFGCSTALSIDQAPDEYMRLDIPFFIFANNALPIGSEPSIVNEIWGFSYAYTPYGSSLLSVLAMKVASLFGVDPAGLVVAARLPSCACGALAVFICIRIGRRLFHNALTPLLFGILVGCLPQFAFTSGYLNNDVASAFSCSLVLLAWIRGLQDGWKMSNCALLGFGLGACAMSYYFGYAYILCSIVVFFASYGRRDGSGAIQFKSMAVRVGIVVLVALAVGGWFFIRNALIHDGDVFGFRSISELASVMAQEEFKPGVHRTPRLDGYSLAETFYGSYDGMTWWDMTYRSFFGMFGYMRYHLPSKMYWCYAMVIFVAVIGMACSGRLRLERRRVLLVVCLPVCLVAPMGFSLYYSWNSGYSPQGRYLFSALPALMLFAAFGIESVGGWISALASRLSTSKSAPCHAGARFETRSALPASLVVLVAALAYFGLFALSMTLVYIPNCLNGVEPTNSIMLFLHSTA